MPFVDDTGVHLENHRGPLWGAFAMLGDRLDRMVIINLAWSIQLLPVIVALAFPELPAWLRLLMIFYTGLAFVPATIVLYGLINRAYAQENLDIAVTRQLLREMTVPGLKNLMPLYSLLGFLMWGANWANFANLQVVEVTAVLIGLLLATTANYWGPLFVEDPRRSPLAILRRSVHLLWVFPIQTILVAGMVLVALVIGAISVGGLFLIIPVLIGLLQTGMYRELHQKLN